MKRTFEDVFELHNIEVRALRGGSKLRLIFRKPEDLDIFTQLVMFRESNVKVIFTLEQEEGKQKNAVTINDVFEFYDLKLPRKKGHMEFMLEQMYEKSKEIKIVPLRFTNCKVFLEQIEQELDFEEDEEEEETEV